MIRLFCFLLLGLIACNTSPKVLEESNMKEDFSSPSTGIFEQSNEPSRKSKIESSLNSSVHRVVVLEVLTADKYIYLRVKEGQQEFWVAAPNQEIKIGGLYSFENGLLKTNFESSLHDRVFEHLYMVSKISKLDPSTSIRPRNITAVSIQTNHKQKGSVSIDEIVSSPKDYESKNVQVSGVCTKVNISIMGRNWIHLADGSNDDFDFVLTTNQKVVEGEYVTMRGVLVLDKDFGAGYRYDILIENATLVN